MGAARTDRNYWIGAACAIGAAVLFGTSWVAVGVALKGFSPFVLAGWRSVITVLLMLPLLYWLGRRADAPPAVATASRRTRGWLTRLLILGFLGGVWFGIGMNISILLTGASITAFIAGAYPVIASAASPFVLGERVRLAAFLGLALAFVGVLLIAGFDVVGLPIAAVRGDQIFPREVRADAWLALFWLAVTAGVIATVLIMESFRRLPTSESSAFLMLNPLTAAVVAVPVLGEMLSIVQL